MTALIHGATNMTDINQNSYERKGRVIDSDVTFKVIDS